MLLCGTVVPGQLEACPERRLVGQIHYLALVCEDAELEARLRARPAWRAWTDEKVAQMLAFNQWVKHNAATTTPSMRLLDTTGRSLQDTAARVRAWILSSSSLRRETPTLVACRAHHGEVGGSPRWERRPLSGWTAGARR